MFLSAELFFFSLWALRRGSLLRLSHVSLLSECFALCGSSEHGQQCWGWNVRCSLEGLAHRGKVMARSSSEKKVPQQILSAKKSRTGDAHASLGRTTPARENPNLRVKLNWKTGREVCRAQAEISGTDFFYLLHIYISPHSRFWVWNVYSIFIRLHSTLIYCWNICHNKLSPPPLDKLQVILHTVILCDPLKLFWVFQTFFF